MRRIVLVVLVAAIAACYSPTEPCTTSQTVAANGQPQPVVVRAGCTVNIVATYDTTPAPR